MVLFLIVGARLAGLPAPNSLELAFGNLSALSATDAVWDLVCDLNGTFSDYVRAIAPRPLDLRQIILMGACTHRTRPSSITQT
jgi:hypothetical protein